MNKACVIVLASVSNIIIWDNNYVLRGGGLIDYVSYI